MVSTAASAADVAAIGVFQGLAPEALSDCAALAVRRALPARRIVFSQGEPSVRFQALVSGRIRIAQTGRDGGLALIRLIGPSEPFGSFGMFVDGCYPAEATTIEPSIELSWSKADFLRLLNRYPVMANNVITLAARRLGELQERLREIITLPAEQRIANALLRLSHVHGRGDAQGPLDIACPLTRKDIAALSATSIYTASRVMTGWERAGIVATAGKRVTIRSTVKLALLVEMAG